MKKIGLIILVILVIAGGLIYYNKNLVDNYNFILNGSENITLSIGDTWEDPLYTVEGNKEVTITDNINYNQIGEYEKTYSIKIGLFEKKLVRTVKIVGVNQPTNFIINLRGSNPYYLMKGYTYQEEGYDVYDQVDGKLSNNVIVTNNINNNLEGNYEVKYQVTNSDGITKTSTRKVIVYNLNFEGKLKTNEWAASNEIILNISDSNYSYTLLPNGTTTSKRNITYRVLENKQYSFTIYDNNGNTFVYETNINNIDKEKPTGTCSLSLLDTGGQITVNANDNGGILGYEYTYGSNKTKKTTSNSYSFSTMDETASVVIYDIANNSTTINCNVTDKSTKLDRDYTLYKYTYNGATRYYWLYQPKISKREKVPLLIYFHGAGGSATPQAINSIAIPKNIYDGHDFPYYVIAPFVAHNQSSEGFILELIDYVSKNYNVDTKRIILTGGSMGSSAPLRIAGTYPNKFSCIVIIAAYNIDNVNASSVTGIPIWVFQGTADYYKQYENYVNKINSLGGNAKITSYKGGHDAPVNAFLREDLTEWILKNRAK